MAGTASDLTLADLLEQFGPIPITRIRTTPSPGEATEQDVIDIERREDRLYELFDGILVEKVMGFYESFLAMLLARSLSQFVSERQLGVIVGEAGMMKLVPGEVRIPDVAFVSWDRLPGRQIPREPIPQLAPDLAVEFISQGNTPKEMNRKLREYFHAGVRLVWYIDARQKRVMVYSSPDHATPLAENEILDGGDVLPGFQLPLTQLFTDPPAPPKVTEG